MFWADTSPGAPKKVVDVAVHHMSWATARAGPTNHVCGLMSTVEVIVVVVVVVAVVAAAVVVVVVVVVAATIVR